MLRKPEDTTLQIMTTTENKPAIEEKTLHDHKPCILCCTDIPKNAKFCTHCNNSQNRFIRFSKELGGNAVMIGILGWLAVNLFFPALDHIDYKLNAKTEAKLAAISTQDRGSAIVFNLGDTPVLIRTITVECKDMGFVDSHPIFDPLNAGETLKTPFKSEVSLARPVRLVSGVTISDLKLLQQHHRFCICNFMLEYHDTMYEFKGPCGTSPIEGTPIQIPAKATLKYFCLERRVEHEHQIDCNLILKQVADDKGQFVDFIGELELLKASLKEPGARPALGATP